MHTASGDLTTDIRVRRWRRTRSVFAILTLAGAVFCVAGAIGNLPTWTWITGFAATLISGALLRLAWDKHREALFAEAPTATGTVVDVLESRDPDRGSTYQLLVDAELANGATIHRRINIGGDSDPLRWIRTLIRFRHRTDDPDDLDDAFFGRMERAAID
ncbi:hypothetical protein [Gordonia sp. VNK21]|uniref:hypothetical protein n=1 Tax=Gordonia sp. VNK21 TaxID=3382483 RepID=UPI0038D44EE7